MMAYNPSVDVDATPISTVETVAETPKVEPEKNLDESQMADFATPIEDLMQPGPGEMMQNEIMGPPLKPRGSAPSSPDEPSKKSKSSKNPFGLTDEQLSAAVAGIAAVIAFSKPVQGKLSTLVPKFMGESGEVSTTGLAVTAIIAAIIFFFAKKFLNER